MPLHDMKCPKCGKLFENVLVTRSVIQACDVCSNGSAVELEIIFLKAPMGFVQRDICYDSPIDGRPITNKHARIEDLRRNGCMEYDPEMRKDMERNKRDADVALDRAVDQTVEAEFEAMPLRKKEKLEQELRAGASAEVVRSGTNN